jgi:hypothetical protein
MKEERNVCEEQQTHEARKSLSLHSQSLRLQSTRLGKTSLLTSHIFHLTSCKIAKHSDHGLYEQHESHQLSEEKKVHLAQVWKSVYETGSLAERWCVYTNPPSSLFIPLFYVHSLDVTDASSLMLCYCHQELPDHLRYVEGSGSGVSRSSRHAIVKCQSQQRIVDTVMHPRKDLLISHSCTL